MAEKNNNAWKIIRTVIATLSLTSAVIVGLALFILNDVQADAKLLAVKVDTLVDKKVDKADHNRDMTRVEKALDNINGKLDELLKRPR